MAAPEYVPSDYNDDPRTYASPPRRPEPWTSDRPGDFVGAGQPTGPMLGTQGPDLGYALKLVKTMSDQVVLTDGEHLDDVVAGCTELAMRRASLFGRAPVIHDLIAAFAIWGYLGDAPDELVRLRKALFAEIANSHHWAERRQVVDMVSDEVLRRPHTQIEADAASDWKSLITL